MFQGFKEVVLGGFEEVISKFLYFAKLQWKFFFLA